MVRVKLVEQKRESDVDEMKRILRIINDEYCSDLNEEVGGEPGVKAFYEAEEYAVGEVVKYNPFMSDHFWIGEITEILENGSILLKPLTETQEFYADQYAQSYKRTDGLYEVRNLECNKFLPNKKAYFKWQLQNGD